MRRLLVPLVCLYYRQVSPRHLQSFSTSETYHWHLTPVTIYTLSTKHWIFILASAWDVSQQVAIILPLAERLTSSPARLINSTSLYNRSISLRNI